jgi:hypothetical protein
MKKKYEMGTILMIVLALILSGCVAGPVAFSIDELEGPKMFSKTIQIEANYQKLAYCYNSKFPDSPVTNIETLQEIGIIKWYHSISQHHFSAIIEFKKISADKTEARLSSIYEKETGLGLPQMEIDLMSCVT